MGAVGADEEPALAVKANVPDAVVPACFGEPVLVKAVVRVAVAQEPGVGPEPGDLSPRVLNDGVYRALRCDRAELAQGELFQSAAVGAYPEVSLLVLEDAVDVVVHQPLLGIVETDLPVVHDGEAPVHGEPDVARAVLEYVPDYRALPFVEGQVIDLLAPLAVRPDRVMWGDAVPEGPGLLLHDAADGGLGGQGLEALESAEGAGRIDIGAAGGQA